MTDIEINEVAVPGDGRTIPTRTYRSHPTNASKVLVWLHGGGFNGGSLDMPESDWVARQLAVEHGCLVVAVDYQLVSDEGPFYPAPSDDVLNVWKTLVAEPELFGASKECRQGLGGASAGANLAAGAVFRMLESGIKLPSYLLLAYPTLHSVQPPHSKELTQTLRNLRVSDPNFPPDVISAMYARYVGHSDPIRDSPAAPGDLEPHDFPPTLIISSEVDELRTSAQHFAASLAVAGTDVYLQREPGTTHGHLNRPDESAAIVSVNRLATWIEMH